MSLNLGTLSTLNLIAGAGILGNVGGVCVSANTDLTSNLTTYNNLLVVQQFANIVTTASANVELSPGPPPVYGTLLSANTLISLRNLSSNIFPAVTNSIPTSYIGNLGNTPNGGLSNVVSTQATNIMGGGDLGKFEQVISSSLALVSQTNTLVNSALNGNSLISTVGYTNQDSIITGGFSTLTQAFSPFAEDLLATGDLIDFTNLNNFGNPSTLLKQIASLYAVTPGLSAVLINSGIPQDIIDNVTGSTYTAELEKKLYDAYTQVTGETLTEVLKTLKVTTAHILTMADLLNPIKIFPKSYQTFTAPTKNGLRAIYIDSNGTVNSLLLTELPQSVLAPLQGNPLQNIGNIV